MRHLNIRVAGRVQGVFFRACTRDKAEELGVRGFVRNEPDGSVYIEAEGTTEILDDFVSWCWQGSPAANVSGVTVTEAKMESFDDFRVTY
jgi:acylphosphatase